MLSNFIQTRTEARKRGRVTLSVAVAQDVEVLTAVKDAYLEGFADAILVGDENLIRPICERLEMTGYTEIIHEPDPDKAALVAVEQVRHGEAEVLMKGLINTGNFMKAALNTEVGLRSGKILSHLAAFEIPGEHKLVFHTDGGINIAPTVDEKRQILVNAVEALHALGIEQPKVAVLAANEQVNPKMQATVDARAMQEMSERGELPACLVEGPIAMDVAASAEAARHKGIQSTISGDVDLFLVPSIEAGNLVGKTLVHYAGAKIAGVILGATHPIVMVSRSDNAEAKLNSIALACLIANRKKPAKA